MLKRFALKPESDEMLTLDFVRFAAATGVVAQHYWQAFIGHEHLTGGSRLDFLSLCVDIFFVISGFVISRVYADRTNSMRGYLAFMKKRVARLGPLHWATLFFFVAIGLTLLIVGRHNNFQDLYDWQCLLPQALFLHAFGVCHSAAFNYPSWSISAEMALYLSFPVFALLARKKRSSLIAIAVLTVIVMYLLSAGPNGDEATGWTNWTIAFGAIRGLAGFSFGVALYAYRDGLSRVHGALALLFLSMLAFVGLGSAGVPPMWLAPLAYAIGFFAIANDLRGERRKAMARVGALGQLTYSIYMLHLPVRFIAVVLIGEHVLNLHGLAYGYWSIFAALLVMPAAWLSLVLFERPTRRWIGGRGRPERAPTLVPAPETSVMLSQESSA